MKLFFLKERDPFESRAALTPSLCSKWRALGIELWAERGLGAKAGFLDTAYSNVHWVDEGTFIAPDVVIAIHPQEEILQRLPENTPHVSLLDRYHHEALIQKYAASRQLLSLERIPRSTLAQKMDVQSSQASIAGYAMVIQAVAKLSRAVPMMTTPAGTVMPQRFLIIGAGVAGLQAIATARRLGANVEAFDTRAEVEEQIKSLGAKCLKIELGETGATAQGYAKALTEEQLRKQREGLSDACQRADVVITTAKLFGRAAPKIITAAMLEKMRPGSLVIDGAVSHGGNVDGSLKNQLQTLPNGVTLWGMAYPESYVATTASELLASNIYNLIEALLLKETRTLNTEHPIWQACRVVPENC
ncbi:MAG: NAD(P)(+) transhydrogenase (Re/Si-specific) subunit alpha [Opitutales bacterium]|nr:NAD(P)(+) transhydrogenase (Re/Si-specific) subunit alpha [Opitutales bacterium]